MPLPELLYAQVVKKMRRRRIVEVKHLVVLGTQVAVDQVLSACGWLINTSFVERLNLSLRQRVAAIRRRSSTSCKGEAGLAHQLALFHVYHNFVLTPCDLTPGADRADSNQRCGSVKQWRPCTPAMAAGLTDHVWIAQRGAVLPGTAVAPATDGLNNGDA